GAPKLSLGGHAGHVATVAFSPDSEHLLTGGQEGVIKVRAASTGKELNTVKAHAQGVSALAFSPDGRLLATGNDHEGKLWNARTLKALHCLPRPAAWLAFLRDGRQLLTGRHSYLGKGSHMVCRWEVATGRLRATLPLRSQGSFAIYHLFSDGSSLFAMAANPADHRLNQYDPQSGRDIRPSQGHVGSVYAVAVHPN